MNYQYYSNFKKNISSEKVNEFYFLTNDNIKLYVKKWETYYKALGNIILIHGFGEHSGRYLKWIEQFTNNGFNVYTLDLRGHGKSEGRRGYAPDYKYYLKDIYLLYQSVIKENNLPVILYGHSFGGNLVINFLLEYPNNKIKAAVVTSPWLSLSFNPPYIKVLIGNIFRYLVPAKVVKTNLPVNGLTDNQKIINEYINDPLVHQKIGVKIYYQIKSAGIKAVKHVYKINTPILILHGINDPITSYKASMRFSKNSSDKILLKLYNIPYHELHNTSESTKIFLDIKEWLIKKIL